MCLVKINNSWCWNKVNKSWCAARRWSTKMSSSPRRWSEKPPRDVYKERNERSKGPGARGGELVMFREKLWARRLIRDVSAEERRKPWSHVPRRVKIMKVKANFWCFRRPERALIIGLHKTRASLPFPKSRRAKTDSKHDEHEPLFHR